MKELIYKLRRAFSFWLKAIEYKKTLKRENASLEVRNIVKKALETMQTVEKKACTHPIMKDIAEGSVYYQCQDCKRIFFIAVAPSWDEVGFKAMQEEMNKVKFGK